MSVWYTSTVITVLSYVQRNYGYLILMHPLSSVTKVKHVIF